MPNVIAPDGTVSFVPDDAVARAVESGFRIETPEEELSRTQRAGDLASRGRE